MKRKALIGIIICLNIVLCVSILMFVRLVTNGDIKLDRKLNLGNKYLLSMDYEKALRAFTDAIDIDPMADAAYTGRGDTYLAMGDYESAWSDYEKAQEITGDDSLCERKFGRTEMLVTDASGAPLPGADVLMSGSKHSFEMETDGNGVASGVICPAEYTLTVTKDDYVDVSRDVEVAFEQRTIDTVVLEISDPNAGTRTALETFAGQFSYMYGNSYTMSAQLSGGYMSRDYGTLPPDGYMGYAIEDFDNDGVPELCIAMIQDYEAVYVAMYEYAGEQVIEQSRTIVDNTNMIPSYAHSSFAGWNGLMSVFSAEIGGQRHIIVDGFRLEAYFADGTSRYITRLTYDGQRLTGSGLAESGGSDYPPEEQQRFENDLLALGATSVDYGALVTRPGAFAKDYFAGASEFVHNEFYTETRTDSGNIQNRGASGSWRCAAREEMR